MGQMHEQVTPSWGWGPPERVLACRISQVLGLIAVLGMLIAIGWAIGG
jgi:hypothetical protein